MRECSGGGQLGAGRLCPCGRERRRVTRDGSPVLRLADRVIGLAAIGELSGVAERQSRMWGRLVVVAPVLVAPVLVASLVGCGTDDSEDRSAGSDPAVQASATASS